MASACPPSVLISSAAFWMSASSRDASTTRAPRLPASSAVASPIPLDAPVMTMTCSLIGLSLMGMLPDLAFQVETRRGVHLLGLNGHSHPRDSTATSSSEYFVLGTKTFSRPRLMHRRRSTPTPWTTSVRKRAVRGLLGTFMPIQVPSTKYSLLGVAVA